MIKNDGQLFLVYTSATEEEGASVFFYDLENGRTCARVRKAELFIDCFPHQTDVDVTLMRYIIKEEIFLRKVDFKKFQTNVQSLDQEENIYEVAPDDQTIVTKSPLKR